MTDSDEKEEGEWARLIYRNQVDGIEAVKRRQWAATNYVLLMFAAIIGFANLFKSPPSEAIVIQPIIAIFLAVIACGISILGIYHLIDMHLVVNKYRLKMFNIAHKFAFVDSIDNIEGDEKGFWKYFVAFTSFFILFILVGFALVVIYLEKSPGITLRPFHISDWLIILSLFIAIEILFALLFTFRAHKKYKDFETRLDNRNKEYEAASRTKKGAPSS